VLKIVIFFVIVKFLEGSRLFLKLLVDLDSFLTVLEAFRSF